MSRAVRRLLIRIHRWTGIALAPLLVLAVLSGVLLSVRPSARLEASGPVSTERIADHDRTVGVASSAADVTARSEIASGVRTELPSHDSWRRSLLLGLNLVIDIVGWAMWAIVAVTPFLAWLQVRRELIARNRVLGWSLLPVAMLAPPTVVLMTLGAGLSHPPPTPPVAISQAHASAAPEVDTSHVRGVMR